MNGKTNAAIDIDLLEKMLREGQADQAESVYQRVNDWLNDQAQAGEELGLFLRGELFQRGQRACVDYIIQRALTHLSKRAPRTHESGLQGKQMVLREALPKWNREASRRSREHREYQLACRSSSRASR
jgi:hypothetical protein